MYPFALSEIAIELPEVSASKSYEAWMWFAVVEDEQWIALTACTTLAAARLMLFTYLPIYLPVAMVYNDKRTRRRSMAGSECIRKQRMIAQGMVVIVLMSVQRE